MTSECYIMLELSMNSPAIQIHVPIALPSIYTTLLHIMFLGTFSLVQKKALSNTLYFFHFFLTLTVPNAKTLDKILETNLHQHITVLCPVTV